MSEKFVLNDPVLRKRLGLDAIGEKHLAPPTAKQRVNFYKSSRWQTVRDKIFLLQGRECNRCKQDNTCAICHVDHIKPLSKAWELRLNLENLQVLCELCNTEKGKQCVDWRSNKIKNIMKNSVPIP